MVHNKLTTTVCILISMIHTGAFAQEIIQPGKWELRGTFTGIPFASSEERVKTACLTEADLGVMPEKALILASPQPTDDAKQPAPPKCEYSQLVREAGRSSWVATCENPKLTGVGNAKIISPEQVDILEKMELKVIFTRSIQHIIHARRLGDC